MIHSSFVVVVVFVGYFATVVVAHQLKNILPKPKILQPQKALHHSTRLKTMNASFPANPSYLVLGITTDSVNCAETFALAYISYILNECITSDSSSSMLVTCEGNTANITEFDGMNCAAPSLGSTIFSGCTEGFSVFACGSSSPFSYGGGNFVVQSNYHTSSCTNQIASTAYLNGKCYPGDNNKSYKLSGLTEYSYTNSSLCSGPYTATSLAGGCELVSDPSTQYYQSYSSYSEVSISSSTTDSNNDNSDKLSGGAIAGIVIGGVVVVALIVAALIYFIKYRSNDQEVAKNTNLPNVAINV